MSPPQLFILFFCELPLKLHDHRIDTGVIIVIDLTCYFRHDMDTDVGLRVRWIKEIDSLSRIKLTAIISDANGQIAVSQNDADVRIIIIGSLKTVHEHVGCHFIHTKSIP